MTVISDRSAGVKDELACGLSSGGGTSQVQRDGHSEFSDIIVIIEAVQTERSCREREKKRKKKSKKEMKEMIKG